MRNRGRKGGRLNREEDAGRVKDRRTKGGRGIKTRMT